jgi:hypothetical protein
LWTKVEEAFQTSTTRGSVNLPVLDPEPQLAFHWAQLMFLKRWAETLVSIFKLDPVPLAKNSQWSFLRQLIIVGVNLVS